MNGLTGRIAALAVLLCFAVAGASRAEVKSDLLKRGVRVSTNSATLSAESEVAAQFKEVSGLKRKLTQAASQLKEHKKGDDSLDTQVARLNQQLVGLNAQMANVQDVVTNNRLIGAIGSIEGQLRLAYESRGQRTKQETALHEQMSVARDGLLTHVTEMRKAADDVARQYYNPDPETLELIAQLNKENGSAIVLGPSSSFLSNLRKLEELESDILSEEIRLRRDGNTYWASVKVNGENSLNMVVDSGAAIVLLSWEDAAKVGVRPGEDAPPARLGVADGRTTTGRKVTIKSLQLGQFTAENVDCVVLNPEAGPAAPLLGMTFLGRFKFQLDGGKSTLSLVKVKDGVSASEKPTRNAKIPHAQLIKRDWDLVPATTGTEFWKNRSYKIESLPGALRKSSLVRRKMEDHEWLSGQVVALEPANVSVALRSSYKPLKADKDLRDLDDATLSKLKNQGWQQLDGFSAPTNARENMQWVLLQKKYPAGPISVPALTSDTSVPALFFVGPQ